MARTSLQALEDKCNTLMRMNLFLALLVLGLGFLWVSKEFAAKANLSVEQIVIQSRAGGPSALVTPGGIVFRDASEQRRAALEVGQEGTQLFLTDAGGQWTATLTAQPDLTKLVTTTPRAED